MYHILHIHFKIKEMSFKSIPDIIDELNEIKETLNDKSSFVEGLLSYIESHPEFKSRFLGLLNPEQTEITALIAPSNIKTTPSVASILVSWDLIPTASSYYVYYKEIGKPVKVMATNAKGLTISNLKRETLYEIQVASAKGGKTSQLSQKFLITTL